MQLRCLDPLLLLPRIRLGGLWPQVISRGFRGGWEGGPLTTWNHHIFADGSRRSEPSTVHHTYISLWCFFSLEGLTVISSTMSRGYLKSGNFLLLSILCFFLLTATEIIFLRFLTTESADCPAPWGKTACPAHTQRMARFLEDFYVCLRTTQHINLDSWTEKTWLASCCIQKYLEGQLLQPSSVHDKCRKCFSTKNSRGKSILQTVYHCCLVTRNDSKWHPIRLRNSSSSRKQTKHTVKLKIPSGLGNHIQLSFTYHPLSPHFLAFGRFNSAEGLPFGIFESMKPTRKIGFTP